MQEKILSLKTPAKINFFLKVLNRRTDGYHNIETVFLPLKDIVDIIKLSTANHAGINIISSSEDVPCDKTNLCYKAAESYAAKTEIAPKWNIRIDKQIPVTAGMGGGSSDAAAVLLLLQHFYDNALSKNEINSIAAQIGADVPFFLNSVPSAGFEVGNVLHPLQVNCDFYVVICAPQFPVTARWAYKNMAQPAVCEKLNIGELVTSLQRGDINSILKFVKNDLAQALYDKFPILSILQSELVKLGAFAAEITGSGPTIFGICQDKPAAEKIMDIMAKKYGSALKLTVSAILKTPYPIEHE